MYNRYIPQPDGSYRRSRLPDTPQQSSPRPTPQREPPSQPEQPAPEPEYPEEPPCKNAQSCAHMRPARPYRQNTPPSRQHKKPSEQKDFGVGNFLRQLLPTDFNTEDLLIVLLLLLMSGEQQGDQNSALLTLALYLFM